MKEYRVPYEEVPWVVIIHVLIIKSVYFFGVLPYRKLNKVRFYMPFNLLIVLGGLIAVFTLLEFIVSKVYGVSLTNEIGRFIWDFVTWLAK